MTSTWIRHSEIIENALRSACMRVRVSDDCLRPIFGSVRYQLEALRPELVYLLCLGIDLPFFLRVASADLVLRE